MHLARTEAKTRPRGVTTRGSAFGVAARPGISGRMRTLPPPGPRRTRTTRRAACAKDSMRSRLGCMDRPRPVTAQWPRTTREEPMHADGERTAAWLAAQERNHARREQGENHEAELEAIGAYLAQYPPS